MSDPTARNWTRRDRRLPFIEHLPHLQGGAPSHTTASEELLRLEAGDHAAAMAELERLYPAAHIESVLEDADRSDYWANR